MVAPIQRNPKVFDAFASVPREKFLGPGPWVIGAEFNKYVTPNRSPDWLYHNVLVSIDAGKSINNGSPSLWAYLFDQLDLKPNERVLQIGAGTGYYTAIIATVIGRKGRVYAMEFEKDLADRARASLKAWPQAKIFCGDASGFDPGEVDVVVAFAGGTHPAPIWLERLAMEGRLLMPIVMDNGRGFMLKATRRHEGFEAQAVSPCGFVLAKGFRNKSEARSLKKVLSPLKGKLPELGGLHVGRLPESKKGEAFFAGRNFWLSKR